MKKVLLIVLIAIFISSIYAGDAKYRPLSLKYEAMGRSGIALSDKDNAFFINSASLADTDGFHFDLPKLNVSLFQAKDILSSPIGRIMDGDIDAILDTARLLNGKGPLLMARERADITSHGFGLSLDFSQIVLVNGQSFASGFTPLLDSVVSIGYGHEFLLEKWSIKLGTMTHISTTIASTPIEAASIVDLIKGNNAAISTLSSSWNISQDIGVIASNKRGFSLGLSANNIGCAATIRNSATGKEDYLYTNSIIGIGTGYQRDIGVMHLDLALDIEDLISLIDSFTGYETILYHTNFGIGLSFSDYLSIYAGLNGGYPSFGMEAKLWIIKLGILYRFQDYGDYIGLSPRDELKLELSLTF